MKTKLTIMLLIFLLLFPVLVKAFGATRPLPYDLELLRGEKGAFKFQVQVGVTEVAKTCTYSVKEDSPLEITFQNDKVDVFPTGRVDIIGFIQVPSSTQLGNYKTSMCVSCSNLEGQSGTSVKQDVCGLPLNVNVVAQRTKENMYIPVETQGPSINMILLIVGSIIFLAAIIIYVIYAHKHHKKKK